MDFTKKFKVMKNEELDFSFILPGKSMKFEKCCIQPAATLAGRLPYCLKREGEALRPLEIGASNGPPQFVISWR